MSTSIAIGPLHKLRRRLRTIFRERELWLLCIPMLVWVGIFYYYPMYGVSMSFVNYIPGKNILACSWVGLKWFKEALTSPEFGSIIRNTLVISGLNIALGFPAPIILALLLHEMRSKTTKKAIQTISYLPHFISWVVAASLVYTMFGSDGVVNEVLMKLGLTEEAIPFLGDGRYFWGLITAVNIWKTVGWSTIIFLSAIAGIDEELYQAGAVDGLGRSGMVFHIILPGIRHTTALLLILAIGQILSAGFEQLLLIGNAQTREYWDVIDTYAYRYGVLLGRYSFGSAVGLVKALISLALVLGANKLSKRFLDVSVI
jgi:putative aldouronate transport system permease protein